MTQVTDSAARDSRDRVIVFDTTMRDGEQSPGASMSLEEKLELAKILEDMRVDVIEAGEGRVILVRSTLDMAYPYRQRVHHMALEMARQGWRVVIDTHLGLSTKSEEPVLIVGHSAGGAGIRGGGGQALNDK